LDSMIDGNVKDINKIEGNLIQEPQVPSFIQFDDSRALDQEGHQSASINFPKSFPLIISIFYSFFLALGDLIWFYILVLIISRFRHRIRINIITRIINYLGIVLGFIGLFFAYTAIKMFVILMT